MGLLQETMEEAAAELDTKFQETERRLDTVAWKVDQLVKVDTEGGESLSAAKLLQNLQEVKKDFATVVKEVEQLKSEQQTAMATILHEFQTAMGTAEQLKGRLDLPPE